MNISELIKELQEALKEHGDLPIHVWADHGQNCMAAGGTQAQWCDEEGECVPDEDLNDPEEELCKEDYTKVLEIS